MKEYIVTVNEDGHTSVIRCANFKAAVDMYRTMISLYGPFSCQIFMEVVTYGETI